MEPFKLPETMRAAGMAALQGKLGIEGAEEFLAQVEAKGDRLGTFVATFRLVCAIANVDASLQPFLLLRAAMRHPEWAAAWGQIFDFVDVTHGELIDVLVAVIPAEEAHAS